MVINKIDHLTNCMRHHSGHPVPIPSLRCPAFTTTSPNKHHPTPCYSLTRMARGIGKYRRPWQGCPVPNPKARWVAFFCWLWGIIILLVPTRGLRLVYAATVGAYAGTSCRKFAYAAYARVVLLRRCLRGYSPGSFSPPVRWGLLDFMWAQCSLPDLNRDHVSSAFRAGPQPRSCVAQCASGDASWRGSAYWKTSWGEGHLRGYNQIRLHLAYGYAYAKNRLQFWFFAANFYYLQMSGTLHLWQVSCEIRLPVFAYGLPTST